MHVGHEKLQNQSKYVEVRNEALVETLKDGLCRAMFLHQKEEHFDTDDIKNKIKDEHKLDTKEKYFDECDLDSALEDENYLLCNMFNSLMRCDCHLRTEMN